MKVLLDECIPRKLKRTIISHDCVTVPEAGLAGKSNGELLTLAEMVGFEILVTIDKGMQYEQNVRGRKIAIIVLRIKSNRLVDILPLVGQCLEIMRSIRPGQIVRVGT